MLGLTVFGTVASVVGVFIGIWTLVTAMGAREAADQALKAARNRNLVEELELAERRIHEIGAFLISDQWPFVQLRAMELVSNCRTAVTRWPEGLTDERKNNLLEAQQIAVSIASEASGARIKPPNIGGRKRLSDTQINASGLISAALAEARANQERSKT
jgi:hypothetical protein